MGSLQFSRSVNLLQILAYLVKLRRAGVPSAFLKIGSTLTAPDDSRDELAKLRALRGDGTLLTTIWGLLSLRKAVCAMLHIGYTHKPRGRLPNGASFTKAMCLVAHPNFLSTTSPAKPPSLTAALRDSLGFQVVILIQSQPSSNAQDLDKSNTTPRHSEMSDCSLADWFLPRRPGAMNCSISPGCMHTG